jgi:hypothetical protein
MFGNRVAVKTGVPRIFHQLFKLVFLALLSQLAKMFPVTIRVFAFKLV